MNHNHAEGKWNRIKRRVEKAWEGLTNKDFPKADAMDRLYDVVQRSFKRVKSSKNQLIMK
jgi:hypothetical protein